MTQDVLLNSKIKPMAAPAKRVHLATKDELYQAYMPFLQRGGLFLPWPEQVCLGQTLSFQLQLMEEPEVLTITAHVVWVTPTEAESFPVPGAGLLFARDQSFLRDKIETYLAGRLGSEHPTHTL